MNSENSDWKNEQNNDDYDIFDNNNKENKNYEQNTIRGTFPNIKFIENDSEILRLLNTEQKYFALQILHDYGFNKPHLITFCLVLQALEKVILPMT